MSFLQSSCAAMCHMQPYGMLLNFQTHPCRHSQNLQTALAPVELSAEQDEFVHFGCVQLVHAHTGAALVVHVDNKVSLNHEMTGIGLWQWVTPS